MPSPQSNSVLLSQIVLGRAVKKFHILIYFVVYQTSGGLERAMGKTVYDEDDDDDIIKSSEICGH